MSTYSKTFQPIGRDQFAEILQPKRAPIKTYWSPVQYDNPNHPLWVQTDEEHFRSMIKLSKKFNRPILRECVRMVIL